MGWGFDNEFFPISLGLKEIKAQKILKKKYSKNILLTKNRGNQKDRFCADKYHNASFPTKLVDFGQDSVKYFSGF